MWKSGLNDWIPGFDNRSEVTGKDYKKKGADEDH
jgi:hypothetical protein